MGLCPSELPNQRIKRQIVPVLDQHTHKRPLHCSLNMLSLHGEHVQFGMENLPMNLGVQYYRAPFPEQKFWADDFAKIKDSGLNTVQLWVLWAWVEPIPGAFRFDDYDRLVELAEKNGLGVVFSTIAEIQPYWIHREVPGSEMIDFLGVPVVSSNRADCHFGLAPGGCTDHPGVWERMSRFLETVVTRYRNASCLRGWDAWNELRWDEQAEKWVCFCPHTLAAYRKWLDERYGGLDNLNKVWRRRYGSYEDIMPGKIPGRPYTEMMTFEHFITWKANQHGKARFDLMKSIDPIHPVTVHGGSPAPLIAGCGQTYAIHNGNDWHFADDMDGIGTSSFPAWNNMDDAEFGMRVECVYSAAQGKKVWLSEIQAARASHGFAMYDPVDAPSQQRWVWNGLACGADTMLFWCWRDEVFGKESAGFGLSGRDGCAEQRLKAMQKTGSILKQHERLFAEYKPSKPEVGIFFSPQSYYLHFAQESTAGRAAKALVGYARSLVRRSIPYLLVEEEHLDALDGLKILFMPRCLVLEEKTEKALERFVRHGGTIVTDSECGAFNSIGFYRYPEDRFLARLTGTLEVGRRQLSSPTIQVHLDGQEFDLPATQWQTPLQYSGGSVWSEHKEGAVLLETPVGRGFVIQCATYLSEEYITRPTDDFERFVQALVKREGWIPDVEVLTPAVKKDSFVYVKNGESEGKRLVFVFMPRDENEALLRLRPGLFASETVRDIISEKDVPLQETAEGFECLVSGGSWRLAVLLGESQQQ